MTVVHGSGRREFLGEPVFSFLSYARKRCYNQPRRMGRGVARKARHGVPPDCLAPYLPVSWPWPTTSPLDGLRGIKEVYCGPCVNPELKENASHNLLIAQRCWDVQVFKSSVPQHPPADAARVDAVEHLLMAAVQFLQVLARACL